MAPSPRSPACRVLSPFSLCLSSFLRPRRCSPSIQIQIIAHMHPFRPADVWVRKRELARQLTFRAEIDDGIRTSDNDRGRRQLRRDVCEWNPSHRPFVFLLISGRKEPFSPPPPPFALQLIQNEEPSSQPRRPENLSQRRRRQLDKNCK